MSEINYLAVLKLNMIIPYFFDKLNIWTGIVENFVMGTFC